MADAWNRRDWDRLRSYYHTGYTYAGGDGKEIEGGPDAGLGVAQMYASVFPDGKLTVKRVYSQGDVAIAEMVARGTHGGSLMGIAPSGREVVILICNVIELRDGRIYREREYMDMLSMMQQIGVTSLPRTAGAA
jgi:steroid delta-isomerase-like uncharacterized protein